MKISTTGLKFGKNTVKTQYHYASESNKHQISWQTQQDLTITITSFIDLCKYTMDKKFQDIYPEKTYIIPRRLNQDIVESWFSHQRGLCGDSQATVSQYAQNNTKLLS